MTGAKPVVTTKHEAGLKRLLAAVRTSDDWLIRARVHMVLLADVWATTPCISVRFTQ
jgi:hypothetical protein